MKSSNLDKVFFASFINTKRNISGIIFIKHTKYRSVPGYAVCRLSGAMAGICQSTNQNSNIQLVLRYGEGNNCHIFSQEKDYTTYKGSYEKITEVSEAVANWVRDNEYDFNGASFSIYHVSPYETQNPEEWETEVCYPVKKK